VKINKIKILEDCELHFGKISSSLEIETDEDKLKKLILLLITIVYKITGQKKLFISASPVGDDSFSIDLKDNYNSNSEIFIEKVSNLFSEPSKNIKIPGLFSFSHKLFQNILQALNGEFEILTENDKREVLFLFPVKSVKKVSDKINREEKESLINISEYIDNNHKRDDKIQEVNNQEKIKPKENNPTPKKTSVDLSRLSCLYIEDQLDSQMLFSSQMRDIKDLDFAVSLEQAVPVLKNKNYDFIVVDINLQGDYNGLDILRVIRTMPEYENIPVIAVTAYILPVNREVYTQAGFSDFIAKPLIQRKFIEVHLEKILNPAVLILTYLLNCLFLSKIELIFGLFFNNFNSLKIKDLSNFSNQKKVYRYD
jgi:CheY-like chemotaxis protein